MRRAISSFLWMAVILAIVFPPVALPGATVERRLTPEEIIKRWKDGPVRYLMTGQEEEVLHSLKTTAQLARFIADFWARRDPTPGTFENEYRRQFWERVAEANKSFRTSTTPGWKTDRGKIFILLGPPFDVQGVAGGTAGGERWTYIRKHVTTGSPEFYAVFTPDDKGELQLNGNPALNSPYYGLGEDIFQINAHVANVDLLPPLPVETASVLANIDLGNELVAARPTPELILATVNAQDFVPSFTASPIFEFFMAKDGSTFVNCGGVFKAADLYGPASTGQSRLRIHASLEPADGSGAPLFASNEKTPAEIDLAKGPEPGGSLAVWTGLAAPPKHYKVTLAIEDSSTGRIGRAAGEIDIPAFGGANLTLSTVVLASSLEELQGHLEFTARASGVFRKSEDFGLYYEVYGLPPQEGGAKFDVRYQFYRDAPDQPPGREKPTVETLLGKPIVLTERTEATQGWSIPLAKWPQGNYKIEVQVTDSTGRTVTSKERFKVVE